MLTYIAYYLAGLCFPRSHAVNDRTAYESAQAVCGERRNYVTTDTISQPASFPVVEDPLAQVSSSITSNRRVFLTVTVDRFVTRYINDVYKERARPTAESSE